MAQRSRSRGAVRRGAARCGAVRRGASDPTDCDNADAPLINTRQTVLNFDI